MRRPSFTLQPVDETFLDSAPHVLRASFDVARPADEVWDELVADHPLAWCSVIDSVRWTSPRPFGVGTTRVVSSLRGLNVLHERFFRWEEGRRTSFYAERSSGPLFRRFAEDHAVEPTGEASCRLTWTIAYEPTALGRPGGAINRRILGSLFRDTRRHFGA